MKINYQIISWRDIPAQVKVKAGRLRGGQPLSQRFIDAIDKAAMRAGKTDSDEYMAEWHTSNWQERDGKNLDDVAATLVSELEAEYPDERLHRLMEQLGYENK
jgi:hypothetical protein